MKIGDRIYWQAKNGVETGIVKGTERVDYLVELEDGREVVVNSRSVIVSDPNKGAKETK